MCRSHPRVTAVARKIPRSLCQKCRWQITPKPAYTFDPTKSEWDDYAAVQAQCGNLSGNEFKRNSSGNTRSQSSQLTEPPWTDPGLNRGISVHELISTLKQQQQQKLRRGMNDEHVPKILALETKATTTIRPKETLQALSACLPACMSACPSVCLPVCLSV